MRGGNIYSYLYPVSIRYTGYGSERGAYEIRFVYEERKDKRVDGRGGYLHELGKRLLRIEVRGYGGALVRGYGFEYEEGLAEESYVRAIKGLDSSLQEWWRYGFEYERPTGETGGEITMFDPPVEWAEGNLPMQVTNSEQGGSQFSLSAGGGIGLADAGVDIHRSIGLSLSSTSGKSANEYTVIDLNGDGLADVVRQEGSTLKIWMNRGNGYERERSISLGAVGRNIMDYESSSSSSIGVSGNYGVGLSVVSTGPSIAKTKQSGSTTLQASIMDIDGDGLPDIVMAGSGVYYKNISDGGTIRFEERPLVSGGVRAAEEGVSASEKAENDKTFLVQRPFRMWKAPYKGEIGIEYGLRRPQGNGKVTAKVYKNGAGLSAAEIGPGGGSGSKDVSLGTIGVSERDRIYYVHDVEGGGGERYDIRGNEVKWNIRIKYTEINPYNRLDELVRFVPDKVRGIYSYENTEWPSIYTNVIDTQTSALIQNREYIPEKIQCGRFFGLMQSKSVEQQSTLAGYYVYDSGTGVFRQRDWTYISKSMKDFQEYREEEERKIRDMLSPAEKDAIIRDFKFFDVEPGIGVDTVLYQKTNTGMISSIRQHGQEGGVFEEGNLVYLGRYNGGEAYIKKNGQGKYRFYVDNRETGYAVDAGAVQGSFQVSVVKDDGRGEEATLQWTFDAPSQRPSMLEKEEVEALFNDKTIESWITKNKREQYTIGNAFWAGELRQEDFEAFFESRISAEELEMFIGKSFDEHIVYVEKEEKPGQPGQPGGPGGPGEAEEEAEEEEPEIDYYYYTRKEPLKADEREYAEGILTAALWKKFLEYLPYDEDERGRYILNEAKSAGKEKIFEIIVEDYHCYKYEGIVKTITYNSNFKYEVYQAEGAYRFSYIRLDGLAVNLETSQGMKLSWDSGQDFVTTTNTEDEMYGGIKLSNDDILYGGAANWYYGIWLGEEGLNPFSQAAMYAHIDQAMKEYGGKTDEIKGGINENEDRQDSDMTELEKKNLEEGFTQKYYNPTSGNEKYKALTDENSSTGKDDTREREVQTKQLTDNLLAGNVSVNVAIETQWANDEWVTERTSCYYFPYIDKDELHTSRLGGGTFYEVSGMGGGGQGGLGLPLLRRSKNKGNDYSVSYGLNSVVSASKNKGTNDGENEMVQNIQDMNGDGIPDIVQREGGTLKVWYGKRVGSGESAYIAYAQDAQALGDVQLSYNETHTTSQGGGLGASGGITPVLNSKGKQTDATIKTQDKTSDKKTSVNAGVNVANAEGTSSQSRGLLDINGDGIPDYIADGKVLLGTGNGFINAAAVMTGPRNISEGESYSRSAGLSLGAGRNFADGSQTKTFTLGVNAGSNDGGTVNYSTYTLMDINGDGLPDLVYKAGSRIMVQFNTGEGYTAARDLNIPPWNIGELQARQAAALFADKPEKVRASMGYVPVIGYLLKNTTSSQSNPATGIKGITGTEEHNYYNEIDYTSSVNVGISGGLSTGGTAKISWGVAATVNIQLQGNGGVSANNSVTGVTVRMMDINGDGYADQVLRIPGVGTFVKLNRGARVGLLKAIHLPQGGTYRLGYEGIGNTVKMPQYRMVLSSVEKDDGETGGGEHRYVTRYRYEDGYYDREEKEFYGFNKVTTILGDGSSAAVQYKNDGEYYHLKGMELKRSVYNREGKALQTVENTYETTKPYPLVLQTVSTRYDERNLSLQLQTKQEYWYDPWSSVVRLEDAGDVRKEGEKIVVEIRYQDFGGGKYLHGHPQEITVKDVRGNLLRRRLGQYDGQTGALTGVEQRYEGGKSLAYRYEYDGYGNMVRATGADGVAVTYTYEGLLHQYLSEIEQASSGGLVRYKSNVEYDLVWGRKNREEDANGNRLEYRYDSRGRLAEVRTGYDTGSTPAVAYEWLRSESGRLYAKTANKIRFAGDDHAVMYTVVEADGLGRARRTAKGGEVYSISS